MSTMAPIRNGRDEHGMTTHELFLTDEDERAYDSIHLRRDPDDSNLYYVFGKFDDEIVDRIVLERQPEKYIGMSARDADGPIDRRDLDDDILDMLIELGFVVEPTAGFGEES